MTSTPIRSDKSVLPIQMTRNSRATLGGAFLHWTDAQRERTSRSRRRTNGSIRKAAFIAAYIDCLFASVRAMAVLSDENAETIAKAAIRACSAQAEELRSVFRKCADEAARISFPDRDEARSTYSALAEKVIYPDAHEHDELLLAVIKERARRRSEPEAQPPSPPLPSPKLAKHRSSCGLSGGCPFGLSGER